MNMKDYIGSLSESEKAELRKALLEQNNTPKGDEPPEEPFVDEDFTVQNREPKSNRGRSEVKGRGKNKWKDEGELRDVETPDFEKTPRRRSAPNKVRVECHVCGKSFKSDPRYVYGEYHRCNKCTGR